MGEKDRTKTRLSWPGIVCRCFRILFACILFIIIPGVVIADNLADSSEVLPVIKVSPVTGENTLVTALELTLEGSGENSGYFIPMKNIQINLTDPDGIGQDVFLCDSVNPTLNLSPGIPVYLVKRNKPAFFLVDTITRGGCGGGGGGGSGSQQKTSGNFSPSGTWKMEIIDISVQKSLGNWTITV